jgi:hypothetical protein
MAWHSARPGGALLDGEAPATIREWVGFPPMLMDRPGMAKPSRLATSESKTNDH